MAFRGHTFSMGAYIYIYAFPLPQLMFHTDQTIKYLIGDFELVPMCTKSAALLLTSHSVTITFQFSIYLNSVFTMQVDLSLSRYFDT